MLLLNHIPDADLGPAQRFANVRGQLLAARQAARIMRDQTLSQRERDAATRSYVAAVDALVEELSILSMAGFLDRIQAQIEVECHMQEP